MHRPMKVRFLRAWIGKAKGAVTDKLQPNVCKLLLQRKIVELVREEPEIEMAVTGPTEHAALRINPPKRKRGRPRKVPVT